METMTLEQAKQTVKEIEKDIPKKKEAVKILTTEIEQLNIGVANSQKKLEDLNQELEDLKVEIEISDLIENEQTVSNKEATTLQNFVNSELKKLSELQKALDLKLKTKKELDYQITTSSEKLAPITILVRVVEKVILSSIEFATLIEGFIADYNEQKKTLHDTYRECDMIERELTKCAGSGTIGNLYYEFHPLNAPNPLFETGYRDKTFTDIMLDRVFGAYRAFSRLSEIKISEVEEVMIPFLEKHG